MIGESAGSLSEEFPNRTSGVPWSEIIGMRHVIVHHYFKIYLNRVWQVGSNDLPELKKMIRSPLEKLGGGT